MNINNENGYKQMRDESKDEPLYLSIMDNVNNTEYNVVHYSKKLRIEEVREFLDKNKRRIFVSIITQNKEQEQDCKEDIQIFEYHNRSNFYDVSKRFAESIGIIAFKSYEEAYDYAKLMREGNELCFNNDEDDN